MFNMFCEEVRIYQGLSYILCGIRILTIAHSFEWQHFWEQMLSLKQGFTILFSGAFFFFPYFSEDDDEIVECDNCGVAVHEGCYGISDNQSIASTESSASTEPWYCDACKAGVKPVCCFFHCIENTYQSSSRLDRLCRFSASFNRDNFVTSR